MVQTLVVVFLGPPGSGKGTQGKELASSLAGVEHMATGDLFRDEIKRKTAVGLAVEEVIRDGKLVSNELTLQVLRSQLNAVLKDRTPSCLILDGYPRNGDQVVELVQLIKDDQRLTGPVFFELEVPRDVIVERVGGRLINPRTGRVYHLRSRPPLVAGICDEDGGELIQRSDDKPEVVGGRFDVYQRGLSEMIEKIEVGHYAHYKFAGIASVDKVSAELAARLKTLLPRGVD